MTCLETGGIHVLFPGRFSGSFLSGLRQMLESLREVVKELNGERVLSDIDFSKTARSMTDEMKGLVG